MEKVAPLHLKICLTLVYVLSVVTNCEKLTMTLQHSVGIEGSPATLSCSYTILDSTYALFDLEWFKGDSFTGSSTLKIADFYLAITSPSYYNGYDDSSRYMISRDSNSTSTFEILNVGFSSDRGRYWCRVTVKPTSGGAVNEKASTDFDVYVLPTSILLFDATGVYLTTGGISYLVEGQERQYSCQVPGIHPAATFTWSVGSQTLMPYANDNEVGADGLINSTTYITLLATWANHGEMLNCQASNKHGNTGLILGVTLDVKVLPKSSSMSLSDSTGTLGDETDVIEGLEHTFTCVVRGTRPAATIKWFLNDIEQVVNTPIPRGDNGLVDTDGDWTFIPQRVNHRQRVKCAANIAESQPPFPSVTTTLNVNVNGTGIPNRPTNVELTSRTSSSITVSWSAGYDGGEDQWFYVSHTENGYPVDTESFSSKITGALTMYKVNELDSYTQYEINIYAENTVGRNPRPSSIVEYTLPDVPNPASDFIIEFNTDQGVVRITGLMGKGGCIQLEVKDDGIRDWMDCGECVVDDSEVELSMWCPHQPQNQRQQAVGIIEDVRARFCVMNAELCSDSYLIEKVIDPGQQSSPTYIVVIGVAVGVVLLIAAVVLGATCRRKRRRNEQRKLLSPIAFHRGEQRQGNTHNMSSDYDDVCDELGQPVYGNLPSMNEEFPREHLRIIRELGSGAFGLVLLAEAKGIVSRAKVTLVAVKTLKEGAAATEKQDMIRELELMKKLPQHNNIVQLLGFCVEQDPPYILIEYLPGGNLKDLMKDSRSKGEHLYGNLHGVSKSLTSGDLMKFASDVAEGMHFISIHKCIHRDLAARNILVAEDMTCKVSDFGLARDVIDTRAYERQSEGRLPLRWMALESILDDVYTTKSDVWSFGVLLWEIVTLGARPYPDMSAKMMVQELRGGYRMPKPSHCQQELYDMMLNCWNKDPDSRPSFSTISDEFNRLREEGADYIHIISLEETVYEVTTPDDIGEKV